MSCQQPVPTVVLDSNVVFDWLVFNDPSCFVLGESISSGKLRWIATEGMLAEAKEVIFRGSLGGRSPVDAEFAALLHRKVNIVPDPEPLDPTRRIICTDPDDQMFIDLAISLRTPWLLTRDNALLRLAGKARAAGVRVVPPAAWSLDTEA